MHTLKRIQSILSIWLLMPFFSLFSGEPQPRIIADPYIVVAKSPNDWHQPPWIGSPSIVKLPGGRLLACFDHFSSGADNKTAFIYASDNQGQSWTCIDTVKNLFWPSLFICKTGYYVIGTTRQFGDLIIYKGTDKGKNWEKSLILTSDLSVHTANTVVLVSEGRITVTFEVLPNSPIFTPTKTLAKVAVSAKELDSGIFELPVEDASHFYIHRLIYLQNGQHQLYARVKHVDRGNNTLAIQPENWQVHAPRQGDAFNTLVNSSPPWIFPTGSMVKHQGNSMNPSRDFYVMAMDAPEEGHLLDPGIWRQSNMVTHPGYEHANEIYQTLDIDFAARNKAGQLVGNYMDIRYNGWLEGTPVRLEHSGGSGEIVNILRLAQSVHGHFSMRTVFNDAGNRLTGRFDHIFCDPGLGITHAAIRYDPKSQLYWMVSNVQRNRPYELVSASKRSKIGNPRSCLGLYYSVDCETWFLAGLVADSGDRVHAFHYPHFIFDGQDLLVIARSHVESPLNEDTVNKHNNTADGHDSNAATFHQVRSFRQLANRSFIHYQKSKSKIH